MERRTERTDRCATLRRRALGLLLIAGVLVVTQLTAGCASGPPKHRTVVFVRNDLNFTVVWDAAIKALSEEFEIAEQNIKQRTIVTGYRHDDDDHDGLRWRVRASVIQFEENWGVQITTEAERRSGDSWKRVGNDDATSKWLVRRVDERVKLAAGPAPPDGRFET